MGIYDRDYERSYDYGGGGWRPEGQGGVQLRWPQTTVGWVLLVTFAAYVVELMFNKQVLLPDSDVPVTVNSLVNWFRLESHWYEQPWRIYGLLSYGLLHAPSDFFHIAGNMFVFWMFGRELERRFGSRELLAFYLASIVVGGLAFCLASIVTGSPSTAIGASAGSTAVLILFVLLFPHQEASLLLLPVRFPMWLLGAVVVAGDVLGSLGANDGRVAYTAHLGGTAFALLYHQQRWRLSQWLPERWTMPRFKRRPKLRVHREPDDADSPADSLEEQLDAILAKIQTQGQDSLTRKERRILEQASRRAKQRRS